jgi:hypothetical protein
VQDHITDACAASTSCATKEPLPHYALLLAKCASWLTWPAQFPDALNCVHRVRWGGCALVIDFCARTRRDAFHLNCQRVARDLAPDSRILLYCEEPLVLKSLALRLGDIFGSWTTCRAQEQLVLSLRFVPVLLQVRRARTPLLCFSLCFRWQQQVPWYTKVESCLRSIARIGGTLSRPDRRELHPMIDTLGKGLHRTGTSTCTCTPMCHVFRSVYFFSCR